MTPIGQNYRASGTLDVRSILSTLILGLTSAVFSALVIWGWEISPIPTLVILTAILQGALIGLVMAFAIGRLKLRNVWLLTIFGFLFGLLSVAMVHFSHHLQFVTDFAEGAKQVLQNDQTMPPVEKAQIKEMLEKEPSKAADLFLVDRTGYPGPIGSLLLRSEAGVQIKSAKLTGWGLWILWGVEALFVAFAAAMMAQGRASKPFCDDCNEWCVEKPGGFAALPGEASRPLADAVVSDQPMQVSALLKNPPEMVGTTYSGVTLHSCPACDQTFADVWLRTDKQKGNKTESSVKKIAKVVRVSPEMTSVLRHQVVPDSVDETVDENAEPVAE